MRTLLCLVALAFTSSAFATQAIVPAAHWLQWTHNIPPEFTEGIGNNWRYTLDPPPPPLSIFAEFAKPGGVDPIRATRSVLD
jgi:hypothetical protein